MHIAHVVACSENGVIGKDGAMPWHLPDELQRFKAITMGKIIVMGRKTYQSIGRPLPGRYSIVITRSEAAFPRIVTLKSSIDEALEHAKAMSAQWQNEICIIGGGEIYKQTLPLIDRIYLTRIHRTIEGDTTYPLEALEGFTCEESEEVATSSLPYSVSIWNRKKS